MQHGMRLSALQRLLRTAGLPALLVTDPANILYLTGLDASEGLVLVQRNAATLFVDGRYIAAAREFRTKALRVTDRAELERVMKPVRRCGFEEQYVTAARLRRWKALFKNTKFVHTSGLTEGLRRKKEATEIIRMKRALRITDAVLKIVPRLLKVGMAEKELAAKLLIACLQRGADGLAFDPIVAFGASSGEPHHRPGDRRLRSKDIVQIDIGARYRGYCSDRCEVYFMGEPTPEQRRVYGAIREVKDAAKKMAKAGTKCAALDDAVRKILKRHKLEKLFTHALGHGVGLEVHEGVSVSGRSKDVLASGEVIAIEPGAYFPGKFGIRLEDMVFVK